MRREIEADLRWEREQAAPPVTKVKMFVWYAPETNEFYLTNKSEAYVDTEFEVRGRSAHFRTGRNGVWDNPADHEFIGEL